MRRKILDVWNSYFASLFNRSTFLRIFISQIRFYISYIFNYFPFSTALAIGFIIATLLGTWTSPSFNPDAKQETFFLAAYDDKSEKINIKSEKGVEFRISWVAKSPKNYLCPHFPCIFIETSNPVNQWIQVGYTDANDESKNFIDSQKSSFIYPFYNRYGKEFFDAPGHRYSFFSKRCSYMKFNAFAVQCNAKNKTIRCLGGIEWGYRMVWFWIRPIPIRPKLLRKDAWENAWNNMIKEAMPEYRVIE